MFLRDEISKWRFESFAVGLALVAPIGLVITLCSLIFLPMIAPKAYDLVNSLATFGSWFMVATCCVWLICFGATLVSGRMRKPVMLWLTAAIPLLTLFNPLSWIINMCGIFHACV